MLLGKRSVEWANLGLNDDGHNAAITTNREGKGIDSSYGFEDLMEEIETDTKFNLYAQDTLTPLSTKVGESYLDYHRCS